MRPAFGSAKEIWQPTENEIAAAYSSFGGKKKSNLDEIDADDEEIQPTQGLPQETLDKILLLMEQDPTKTGSPLEKKLKASPCRTVTHACWL